MTRTVNLILVGIAIFLDQVSKYWVETSLPLQERVPVLPFLDLYRTYNTGIAFSMLSFLSDWVLALLTICIVGFVLWLWSNTSRDRKLTHIGFALIVGGALGNLIDRTMLGHVIDFILVHHGSWSFAVFNLADSFISVGAGFVILDELLEMKRNAKNKAAKPD